MIYVYIAIIVIAIVFEGFFSGAEIAIISLNRIRLRILAEAKDKRAILIHLMLCNPDKLLGTTLVGTNLAVVIATSFCTEVIHKIYNIDSAVIPIIIISPIVLIFGEFIPKSIFSQRADKITFNLAFILYFFWNLFYPIVWFISRIVTFLLKGVIGPTPLKKSPFVTREEIKHIIKESEEDGEIDPYERSIIYKIFDFGKKKVQDVMRDIKEIVSVSVKDNIKYLIEKAESSGYSRFPIVDETGGFVGLVNILDVVYEEDRSKLIQEFIRPIQSVMPTTDIDNALFLLQSNKHTMALVKDSTSRVIGFFTMEDLLEEIVGEI